MKVYLTSRWRRLLKRRKMKMKMAAAVLEVALNSFLQRGIVRQHPVVQLCVVQTRSLTTRRMCHSRSRSTTVYEYPRETSDSDSERFDSPTHQHWNSLMLQSTQQPQVDYSSFADWELLDSDVVPDTDTDQDVPTENTPQQQLDFYKLSSGAYDFINGMVSEDGKFYISSSAHPFQFPGGNNDVLTSGSQFFPGQLYHTGSKCKPADITADFVTPDSGIIDVTLTDKLSVLETGLDSYDDEVDTSPSSMSRFVVSFNDHQLSSRSSDRIKVGVWEDEASKLKFNLAI